MRNVSDKRRTENQTHILYFSPKNRAVYEIMWKNVAEQDRPQMTTIRRMRFACRISTTTNTHSEYVILIDFPLQQWLHENASMLRNTYAVCLLSLNDSVLGYLRNIF